MTEYFVTHSEVMALYIRVLIFVLTVKWYDMNHSFRVIEA